jgi:hypothetical protein
MAFLSDLFRASRFGPRVWADLVTATAELALARTLLAIQGMDSVLASGTRPVLERDTASNALIDRVAFATPRMGQRVPWKGSCLVQSLAARNWLARHGIDSEIRLGARKAGREGLDAHAWLVIDDRVVIGGDVGGYSELPISEARRPH